MVERLKIATIIYILIAVTTAILIISVNSPLIQYPALALFFGTILAAAYTRANYNSNGYFPKTLSTRVTRIIDTVILTAIGTSTMASVLSPNRLSSWYLFGTVLVSLAIALRVLIGTRDPVISIVEIMLLTLSLRVIIWTSYPIYGQDSPLHTSIAGYIANTGHLLPEGISYYRNYPGSHVLGSIGMVIGNIGDSKQAFFLTVGLTYVLTLSSIYVFSRRIMENRRAALLATLFVAMSTGPLRRGSQVIAQTLADALFPVIFVTIMSNSEIKRRFVVGSIIVVSLLIVHNLPPLVLVGVAILITFSSVFIDVFSHFSNYRGEALVNTRISTMIGVIAGVAGFYFWIIVDYFSYQVNRIATILTIGSAGAASAIQPTNAASPPTIILFGVELPALLLWAAPLLIVIFITVFVGLVVLADLLASQQTEGPPQPFPMQYLVFGLLLAGAFTGAYAIGGGAPVIRSLQVVTVLLSPLFGFVVLRISRLPTSNSTSVLVVILLVASVIVTGVFSPSVAMANRDPGSFVPAATSEDISMVAFAGYAPEKLNSDNYLTDHMDHQDLSDGDLSGTSLNAVISNNVSTATSYRQEAANKKFMAYRYFYKPYYGLKIPNGSIIIYSNGKNNIYKVVN